MSKQNFPICRAEAITGKVLLQSGLPYSALSLSSVWSCVLTWIGVQGLWWQPTASSQKAQPSALAQSLADAEGGGGLLALAAAQRMNTETRRAVFCIVMGSQDAVDASERLLRLPLKVAFPRSHHVLHHNNLDTGA